jgi:hypothetical protein
LTELREQRDVVQHPLSVRASAPPHVGFGNGGQQIASGGMTHAIRDARGVITLDQKERDLVVADERQDQFPQTRRDVHLP